MYIHIHTKIYSIFIYICTIRYDKSSQVNDPVRKADATVSCASLRLRQGQQKPLACASGDAWS